MELTPPAGNYRICKIIYMYNCKKFYAVTYCLLVQHTTYVHVHVYQFIYRMYRYTGIYFVNLNSTYSLSFKFRFVDDFYDVKEEKVTTLILTLLVLVGSLV